LKVENSMIQRYLIVWLSLSSLLAYVWPYWCPNLGDPWDASQPFLWWMIAVTMLAIGYLLPRDEMRQVLRRWPTVLGGTAVQYTTMPIVAYLVGCLFALSTDAMIGIVIVGCVPGAMASNVLTLNARGNTSYSVSLTATATILSPLVVPLTLGWALGKEIPFDPLKAASKLLLTVVLPVVAGHSLRQICGKWDTYARPAASLVANLVILWIIAVVVGMHREQLGGSTVLLVLPLIVVNVVGYLAGYGAACVMRLPEPMRRALTLEVGMQNAGLGTVLAVDLFRDQPAAAILPAAYTFGCMFTGTILARRWAGYPTNSEAGEQ